MNTDAIAGSVGELLSANVFAYCQNNPVKLIDKDGFHPAEWDESDSAEDDSSSQSSNSSAGSTLENIASYAWSTASGALAEHLSSVKYTLEREGTLGQGPSVVKSLPECSVETVKPYAKVGGELGIAGTVGFWAYDTINIFRAHDGLTSGQKWAKFGIHTAFVIGVFAIGAVFLAPLFAGGAAAVALGFVASAIVGAVSTKAEDNVDKITGLE